MTACGNPCLREIEGIEAYGSPALSDEEWVCRSVRPQDFNAKGVLRPGFVHARPLKEGWLSVWRVSGPDRLADVADRMAVGGEQPFNVLAARTADLRAITIRDERAICVINDTRITEAGDHDLAHAALSACARFMPWTEEQSSVLDFEEVRSKVMLAFRAANVSLNPMPQPAPATK